MKLTLTIPTNGDWNRLDGMRHSLIYNTSDPTNVDVIFFDNGNTNGHDIQPWIDELAKEYKGKVRLVTLPQRIGLTSVWKACTDLSNTEWTIVTNDDMYFMPGWDTTFIELTNRKPQHGCLLLCNPYNWSGFAISKAFVEKYPWRTEFPEGYYEDDDIYLRVAVANNAHTIKEVYNSDLYSYPVNDGKWCFEHRAIHSKAVSKFHRSWDGPKNKLIFDKYWREVAPGFPNAIENKNGKYFIPA